MSKQSIHASDEAWEDRLLGSDEKFVKVAGMSLEASINKASGFREIKGATRSESDSQSHEAKNIIR